ncbi:MAG: DNA-binding response regulator [Sphingomonas sp.]|uniref:DNA-binding response regulator n=1 Tax=Sphingomonas adhaesiva TaxID=28212 RepID=A0A2A4I917_9SPHN|nr:DNA-binding response regulator [Sphingomonas adhaesiva]PZU81301.1 MAG: DNA-binding response regulator [Sphingomonas sp.]
MNGDRLLIADDHPLTREGLSLAARAALPGAQAIGVGTVGEAVAALQSRRTIRLILLDYALPDSEGFRGLMRVLHVADGVPVVIVTASDRPGLAEGAMALGAAGFLPKTLPLDEISTVLREVLAGQRHFPASAAPAAPLAAARQRISGLSRAQYAVLLALADGRSNKQIAYDLSVTEATVKAHLTAVFRKLKVTNRTQALLAIRPLLEDPASGQGG